MAIAVLNPSVDRFSGALGEFVYKQYGDKTVVTSRPCFKNRILSPAQQANLERFRRAAAYARQIKSDPVLLAQYREKAKSKGMTFRNFVFKEYFAASKDPVAVEQNSATVEAAPRGLLPDVSQPQFDRCRDTVAAAERYLSKRIRRSGVTDACLQGPRYERLRQSAKVEAGGTG